MTEYHKNVLLIQEERNARIDREGTPPAIFLNSADIAVDTNNGGWVLDFQKESKTQRYVPYEEITISNNSDSALNVYVNQHTNWQKVAFKGQVLKITDFPSVRSVRISKRDATVTISAGEVEVNVERAPLDADSASRRDRVGSPFQDRVRSIVGGFFR